jgi:hypothetical protein
MVKDVCSIQLPTVVAQLECLIPDVQMEQYTRKFVACHKCGTVRDIEDTHIHLDLPTCPVIIIVC